MLHWLKQEIGQKHHLEIFAGDFAQLKPVFGSPLYSHTVGTSLDASMTVRSQQSAIGKALWHQVTTVVILRQNMHQKTQSTEDAQFRTALENMRYAQCSKIIKHCN